MSERIVQEIAIERITCGTQVRESSGLSAEDLAGLAQSIKEAGGVLQPILARREGDALIVLDGHRRVFAAKRAGLATIPVIMIESELSESEVTYRQLVLDAQRVQLNPIERGRAIDQLMRATQWPASTVAVRLGVSPASVSKLLALLELPEEVQRDVASGRLAMSTAYALARVGDAAEREALAAEAANGRLTREALSRKMRRIQRSQGNGTAAAASRVTAILGDGRSITVSGRGLSIETLVEWIEQLLVKARKARSQGLELATFIKMLRDQGKSAKGSSPC